MDEAYGPPCGSRWGLAALRRVAEIQCRKGAPLDPTITCATCQSTVIPVKRYTWWAIVLWVLFFWPGVLVYILTRRAEYCPACSGNVYQRRAVPTPAPPAPAAPAQPTSAVEQNAREQMEERRDRATAGKMAWIISLPCLVIALIMLGICVGVLVAVL